MTTLVVSTWGQVDEDGGPTTVAVVDDQEEAERIALVLAVNTARTTTVTESPLDLANARLQANLCPECGSSNVRWYYVGSNFDPGDAEPAADCRDCGWGY